jgi:hypothetical protein
MAREALRWVPVQGLPVPANERLKRLFDLAEAAIRAAGGGGSSTVTLSQLDSTITGPLGDLLKSTTVTIAPAVFGVATVSVSDADAAIGRPVLATLSPSVDFDADEMDGMQVIGECGTGTVAFTVLSPGPIVGTLRITYSLGWVV